MLLIFFLLKFHKEISSMIHPIPHSLSSVNISSKNGPSNDIPTVALLCFVNNC